MSTKYPLIEKCGLEVFALPASQNIILADSVEEFLAKAPVVFGGTEPDGRGEYKNPFSNFLSSGIDTHSARLIMVEPLRPKTFDLKIDTNMPPDEFHIITSDGERHVFHLKKAVE